MQANTDWDVFVWVFMDHNTRWGSFEERKHAWYIFREGDEALQVDVQRYTSEIVEKCRRAVKIRAILLCREMQPPVEAPYSSRVLVPDTLSVRECYNIGSFFSRGVEDNAIEKNRRAIRARSNGALKIGNGCAAYSYVQEEAYLYTILWTELNSSTLGHLFGLNVRWDTYTAALQGDIPAEIMKLRDEMMMPPSTLQYADDRLSKGKMTLLKTAVQLHRHRMQLHVLHIITCTDGSMWVAKAGFDNDLYTPTRAFTTFIQRERDNTGMELNIPDLDDEVRGMRREGPGKGLMAGVRAVFSGTKKGRASPIRRAKPGRSLFGRRVDASYEGGLASSAEEAAQGGAGMGGAGPRTPTRAGSRAQVVPVAGTPAAPGTPPMATRTGFGGALDRGPERERERAAEAARIAAAAAASSSSAAAASSSSAAAASYTGRGTSKIRWSDIAATPSSRGSSEGSIQRGYPGFEESMDDYAEGASPDDIAALQERFREHLVFEEEPDAGADIYREEFTCFCFGRGPPQLGGYQRMTVNYVNMNQLFSGYSTIFAEYRKYCDRHARSKFDSDLMATIHESQQLLVLVHTVVPLLANHRTFVNMMGRFATRQQGEDGSLVDMMQMMRKLQVAGEFDHYFKIPKDDGIPVHYAKRITNRLETRYTRGEEWEYLKHKLPTSA